VLVGEGADEIFGGYLYFGNAPDARAFHDECVRRSDLLYTCELLRVDRSTMSIGVEARVPFLDKEFLAYVLSIDPTLKLPVPGEKIEKYIMRKAFDTPDEPYLPDCVLWR
jgi:asparagine synthase (glutamine-hydrolysing)